MNAKARELGLTDTSFENPHGLDEAGHLSSARDATLLVRHALGIPILRDALGRTSFSFLGRDFPSTDDLNVELGAARGREDGPHRGRGLVGGGRRRGARRDRVRRRSRRRLPRGEKRGAAHPARLRARALPAHRRHRLDRASTRRRRRATGGPAVDLVAPRTMRRTVHERRSLVERVIAPALARPPRPATASGSVASRSGTATRCWRPRTSSPRPRRLGAGRLRQGRVVRRSAPPRTCGASSRDRHRHRSTPRSTGRSRSPCSRSATAIARARCSPSPAARGSTSRAR